VKRLKGLLLDIDGVLYVGDKVIDGAVKTVNELRRKYKIRFITNTTTKPRRLIYEKLRSMGFDVREEEIFSALTAVKEYLKTNKEFFLEAVESMNLKPEEVAVVGDDIEADVKGGMDAGLFGILVKTGKFKEDDLKKGIKPNLVIDSIKDLTKYL